MKKEKIDIVIREAIPDDAKEVLRFLEGVATETGFLSYGAEGLAISEEDEKYFIENILNSENNLLLVAILGEQIIGTASVKAEAKPKMKHIGEIGISISKDFWGFGLGTMLMEELIIWAEESEVIRRLELTVQDRNQRAIHLYEKMGFEQEGLLKRGVYDDGEYLDVQLMSKMIDA